jgi:DNA-binding CsgD family transcriptional regulator
MSRLTWSDARAIFELLGELRDLGRDPLAWRTWMLGALAERVGAKVAIAAEAPVASVTDSATYLAMKDIGFSASERAAWWGTCDLPPDENDPAEERYRRVGHGSFTARRQDFVDDRTWYRSAYACEVARRANFDHTLISHQAARRFGSVHVVLLYRAWGEPPFGAREVAFVDRFHRELGRLWRDADPGADHLPRRLRETLAALEAGDSEKQVAARLGVAPSTVHDYVKAIYRHYRVHSRGELLARTRRPTHPRLAHELAPPPRPTSVA